MFLQVVQADLDGFGVAGESLGLGNLDGGSPESLEIVGVEADDGHGAEELVDAEGRTEAGGAAGGHDVARAGDVYRKVALNGVAQAQYNMGVRHAQGQGVPMDFIAGYAWMNLAAGQGLDSAVEYREILESRMTARELVEAKKLSVELGRSVQR